MKSSQKVPNCCWFCPQAAEKSFTKTLKASLKESQGEVVAQTTARQNCRSTATVAEYVSNSKYVYYEGLVPNSSCISTRYKSASRVRWVLGRGSDMEVWEGSQRLGIVQILRFMFAKKGGGRDGVSNSLNLLYRVPEIVYGWQGGVLSRMVNHLCGGHGGLVVVEEV